MDKPPTPGPGEPELPAVVVSSAALERKLDRLSDSKPVIWVAAPPRSGKRTAVATWLRRRNRRFRWVRAGDRDPAAATRAEIDSTVAANPAAALPDEGVTIVLDGAQAGVDDLDRLERLVADQPAVQQVIVLDDRVPVAGSRRPEVTASDLALSAATIEAATHERGLDLPSCAVRLLAHHYSGNPAVVGTVVNGSDDSSSPLPADGGARGSSQRIAYAHAKELVTAVASMLGENGLDLAALLALTTELPRAVALDLLSDRDVDAACHVLWERGLVNIDSTAMRGGMVYRLPPLVREYVRARTMPRYLARRGALHRHAASAFVLAGDLVEAVRLLEATGDSRSGVDLVMEQWDRFHHRAEGEQVVAALRLLDQQAILENPEASAVMTIVTALGSARRPAEPFESRVAALGDHEVLGLSLRARTTIRIAQVLIAARLGRAEAARRAATLAFSAYEHGDPQDRLELRGVHVELVLAGAEAALLAGSLRECAALFEEAATLARHESSVSAAYRASVGRALTLAWSGEVDASREAITHSLELRQEHPVASALPAGDLVWAGVLVGVQSGSTPQRLKKLLAEHADDPDVAAAARYLEVRRRLTAGRSAEAVGMLRLWLGSVRDPVRGLPLVSQLALQTLALAQVLSGQPGAALRTLRGVRNNPSHIPCSSRVVPLAYILQGRPREALAATEPCIESGHDHSLLSLPYVFLARALAFEALDLPSSAEDEARSGLATIVETGARVDLRLTLGRDLAPILDRVRRTMPELFERAEPLLDGLPRDTSPGRSGLLRITPRERDLLVSLATEATIPEIARMNFVSENTVKTHLRNIYAKLAVGSRQAAVDVAIRSGIIGTDDSSAPL